jgi:CRP-like cAMP-binding protein
VVAREGDRGEALYLVAAGELRVFVKEKNGERTIACLQENAVFGELPLATGRPRTASVAVMGEADLLQIGREALERVTAQHPTIGQVLDRFTRERLVKHLLHTSPLFTPFSPAEKAALLRRFDGQEVAPGTEIIRQGEPGRGLYLVLTGELEVVRTHGRGVSVIFGHLGPGDICGEMSLLAPRPTSGAVRAVRPTTVLFLARSHFEESLGTVPELRASLESMAAQRTRENTARLGTGAMPPDIAALEPSTVWLL